MLLKRRSHERCGRCVIGSVRFWFGVLFCFILLILVNERGLCKVFRVIKVASCCF